ncbi:hypothetical protein [Bradyrhizobium jicamae]|uniref:hypothetical protein n=1 Tax=Bradyrhizobium jicamae TaxID=280332 RepID=UPI001BAD0809|nr:hypothetical protein [Bradyrhizobium jicamae]MBR0939233.1 hypothetical protein [Bradyrhizobium jicamae]
MKTSQSKVNEKESRKRAGVKAKRLRRADYGLKLSNLFIEDLIDNEDLSLHLGVTASLYAESPKGVRKLIDAVLMQMCGITFATIIAAAEQNTTVLKAEVKYDYKRLPNLDVEELRQCLDEV